MNELDKALELYEQTFDDSFPMFSMMTKPPDEVVDIINKCVSAKKDVYDMGYLSLNDDTMYQYLEKHPAKGAFFIQKQYLAQDIKNLAQDTIFHVFHIGVTCVSRIQIDPFSQQFFMNSKHKKTLENTGFPRVLMFF